MRGGARGYRGDGEPLCFVARVGGAQNATVRVGLALLEARGVRVTSIRRYLLAASMAIAMAAPVVAWDLPGAPLTDAATRLAADLREGAGNLGAAGGSRLVVRYHMKSWPEGCAGAYEVQIEERIVAVWCKADGKVQGSYTTSSHSAPVTMTIDRRWLLAKPAATPLVVTFERRQGKAAIVQVE